MPVRPPKSSGGSFTGFKAVAIQDVQNKNVDAVDIALDLILKVEGSEYPKKCSIFGSFDWDDNGNIKENSFLKRIYRVFDGIGEQGGVNIKGMWVDKNDKLVEDIEQYLGKYIDITKFPYITYIYKQKSKKDGKVYSNAYPMLVPNTSQGMQDITGYIKFMQRNKYLVEYNENDDDQKIIVDSGIVTNDKTYNAGF